MISVLFLPFTWYDSQDERTASDDSIPIDEHNYTLSLLVLLAESACIRARSRTADKEHHLVRLHLLFVPLIVLSNDTDLKDDDDDAHSLSLDQDNPQSSRVPANEGNASILVA